MYRAFVEVEGGGTNHLGQFVRKSEAQKAVRDELRSLRRHGYRARGKVQGFKEAVTDETLRELGMFKHQRKRNPLPVGKFVTVRAIRRKNGQVDLYR